MNDDGWIKLYRKLRDHSLWEIKPFSKGQAWVDLLLKVNHKRNRVPMGNNLIEVYPGQTITSELGLSERWGWGRHKVHAFLNFLQRANQIVAERTSQYTLITIVNWASYQSGDSQKDNVGTTEGQRRDTNKNEKNEKKEEGTGNEQTATAGFIMEGFDAFKAKFQDDWNLCATENGLSPIKILTKDRETRLLDRYQEAIFRAEYPEIFYQIARTPFLCGVNPKKWKVNFDWLIADDFNYIKVLEGVYSNNKLEDEDGTEIA